MSSSSPMVSIIIPVYNSSRFLHDCLRSVIGQSYENLEIICVNDGSSDNSESILIEFFQVDRRITIINQNNQGLSCARNTGIDNASGDYLFFLDSDDWLEPDCIESMILAAIKHNCKVVTGAVQKIFVESGEVRWLKQNRLTGLIDLREISFFSLETPVWNKLYKRDSIGEIRFTPKLIHEDEDFYWQVFSRNPIVYALPLKIINYRIRSNSLSHQLETNISYQDNFITIIDNAYKCAKNNRKKTIEFKLYALDLLRILRERNFPFCKYKKHVEKNYQIRTFPLCYTLKKLALVMHLLILRSNKIIKYRMREAY